MQQTLYWINFFLSKAESWTIGAKTWALKSCSDIYLILTSHGVFQGQNHLKNCLTSIWLSLLMVSSKVDLNFSQNCSAHITCSQRTISNTTLHHWYKFPVQGYISITSVLRWLAWLKKNCFFMNWFYYNLIILIR